MTKNINLKIEYSSKQNNILNNIQSIAKQHKGKYNVVLHMMSKQGRKQKILLKELQLACDDKTLEQLRNLLGLNNVWLSI